MLLKKKNTGVGYHFFLQGIFATWGLNPCLLHWQVDSLPLSYLGSPVGWIMAPEDPNPWHLCMLRYMTESLQM